MGRLVRRYIRGYNITAVNHLETDNIVEHTSGAGVTIDGLEIKDGRVTYYHPRILKIPFGHETSETDTGVDLPDKAMVLDVWLEVTTADSGITIDVGLLSTESGGDADGFLDGAPLDSTGLVFGGITPTITSGTNNTYLASVARTIGVLLADLDVVAGQDVADGGDGACVYERKPFPTDSVTAKSISYTCSAGADTAAGYIYILLVEFE